MANKKREKGFTLIELMIVIAIIGILAAVAIPQFQQHRVKGFNTAAKSDVKNAYTAALAYFNDSPAGSVTSDILESYGYTPTENVTLTVINGTMATLDLRAKHAIGNKTYRIDQNGTIIEGSSR